MQYGNGVILVNGGYGQADEQKWVNPEWCVMDSAFRINPKHIPDGDIQIHIIRQKQVEPTSSHATLYEIIQGKTSFVLFELYARNVVIQLPPSIPRNTQCSIASIGGHLTRTASLTSYTFSGGPVNLGDITIGGMQRPAPGLPNPPPHCQMEPLFPIGGHEHKSFSFGSHGHEPRSYEHHEHEPRRNWFSSLVGSMLRTVRNSFAPQDRTSINPANLTSGDTTMCYESSDADECSSNSFASLDTDEHFSNSFATLDRTSINPANLTPGVVTVCHESLDAHGHPRATISIYHGIEQHESKSEADNKYSFESDSDDD